MAYKGVDSGLVVDRLEIVDPTIERVVNSRPVPNIEVWYRGLSNVVSIKQGEQVVNISTRRIRRLIAELENVEGDEEEE